MGVHGEAVSRIRLDPRVDKGSVVVEDSKRRTRKAPPRGWVLGMKISESRIDVGRDTESDSTVAVDGMSGYVWVTCVGSPCGGVSETVLETTFESRN